MSDNPHRNLSDALPLPMYGDMILDAYRKLGMEVVVTVHVGDLATGAVTGTSNMPPETEHEFMKWILRQREEGGVSHEEVDYGDKDNPKEKLN